jgi:ectoine hydroxylase-related dioxygenase (phytanoyl-CoA dioxygenase family)
MKIATFPVSLADATKAAFDRNGFATIDRITTDEEAAWLRGLYDRFLVRRFSAADPRALDASLALGNTLWISLDRWESFVFQQTALGRNALELAAGLLEVPKDDVSMGIRFFCKPAHGGRPVPWHQDEAHQDPAFDHHSVNVWVPFDATNEDNGCVRYVPGSHLGGIRVHRHPGNGAPEVALLTDDVCPSESVPARLPALGAAFHHCRTVHGSGPNTTGDHRRALVVVCRAPPKRRAVPAERPWLTLDHLHVPETSFES